MDSLFNYFIVHTSRAPPRGRIFQRNPKHKEFWKKRAELLTHFRAYGRLMATFRVANGENDARKRVRLVGALSGIIMNVVEIHIEYTPPTGYSFVDGKLCEFLLLF